MIIEIQEKKMFTEIFGENKLNKDVMTKLTKKNQTERIVKSMPPPLQPMQHPIMNYLIPRTKEQ